MKIRQIADANQLFNSGDYSSASSLYTEILSDPTLPRGLAESLIFNVGLCNSRLQPARRTVGEKIVRHIDEVALDMDRQLSPHELQVGISALLRAKNAERFIVSAVESVVDLVDEVVAVDNNSSDATYMILCNLQEKYPNLTVYRYNIDIPMVGTDHEKAVQQGSANTLGTYYNWCLSKVTKSNVLKWDADFVCIRANLVELINTYALRTEDFEKAVWCTGITSYYGRTLNLSSYYDEFRIFSKKHGGKWDNWRGCETLTPSISRSPRQFIFPHKKNVKNLSIAEKAELKGFSKPVFVEIKDYLNVKPDSMVLDRRDIVDNNLIKRYKDSTPDYFLPNKLNSYSVLILLPNLRLGGGNYWATFIFDQLKRLGINVTIGALNVVHGCDHNESFHKIPLDAIFDYGRSPDPVRLDGFSHILLTAPLPFDISLVRGQVFPFTHSDISYFNDYVAKNFGTAVALNTKIVQKFQGRGVKCATLHNYLPYEEVEKTKAAPSSNFRVLYCNRISEDKNVAMLISAFARVIKINSSIHLTILAGASNDSPVEYLVLQALIRFYGVEANITLLANQTNVADFYRAADCVVLPSVSEGCSYGLLEAINFGVPVISTRIAANTEVTQGRLPHFDFVGLQEQIDGIFSVPPSELYAALLDEIGYIRTDRFYALSSDGKINYEIFSAYFSQLGVPFEKHRRSVRSFCPPVFGAAVAPLLASNNAAREYFAAQLSAYERNCDEIATKILDTVKNFSDLREVTLDLKESLKTKYFDRNVHLTALCNILFSNEFDFVNEAAAGTELC